MRIITRGFGVDNQIITRGLGRVRIISDFVIATYVQVREMVVNTIRVRQVW